MEWRTQQTQWPAQTTWQSLERGGVKEEQQESQRHSSLTKPVKYVKSETVCDKDTWHCKRLGEGMEGRAPGNLPRRDVGINKLQLIKELP